MKDNCFELGSVCDINTLQEVASGERQVRLAPAARGRLAKCREKLMRLVKEGPCIYGINTGFGELASVRIPERDCKRLQLNLVRSHACGTGAPLSAEQARGMMFLRANELARCHSGVRPVVVETLAACINKGVIPYVPSRGSVGASGDLSPSAHVALMLIGEGRAKVSSGKTGTPWLTGAAALKKAGIKPLALEEKEGLALINGTQAMQSVGGLALLSALKVWHSALAAGAMSLEALKGTPAPFCEAVSGLKPHYGQIYSAALLRRFLDKSEIRSSHLQDDDRVQDPYSLRCMPQVHGAARDALEYSIGTVETEMQSVTDNPMLVWDEGSDFNGMQVISGGNFHGQALSLAFDIACAAATSLGNIAERRIFQLVSDSGRVLPPFLAKNSGLESGWMISQYAAAALASENKTLAHPASCDSIPTSANKEDFVSMGMWAAHKLERVVDNTAAIVAIELLAGAQGLEFHHPLKPGTGVRRFYEATRSLAPALKEDRPLTEYVEKVKEAVLSGSFVA